MNTKVNKLIKLAAAGLFLIALAINVKVTMDDPFTMVTEQALASDSGGSGTSFPTPDCNICVYSPYYSCIFTHYQTGEVVKCPNTIYIG